ncbi:MAG TPA: DUF1570 domain-containing protein [Planctomycetota bacterium]|nr:DUF1570 domain-containing protein [Planctomycetota bacterium]
MAKRKRAVDLARQVRGDRALNLAPPPAPLPPTHETHSSTILASTGQRVLSGIGILLLALLGQSAGARDEILLKDGRKIVGLIEEENDEQLVLRIIVKGQKGETAVTGKVTLRRDEIAEVRRIEDDAREDEQARVEAFEDREWEHERRLANIAVAPARLEGQPGFTAAGDLFVVRTTCGEDFAREACDALQQAYEGYLRHFKLRRNGRVQLPVVILDSRDAYHEYLTKKYGGTVPGSLGIYDPDDNIIISFNCVQREEADRVRKAILEQREKIEGLRKEIRRREKGIDEEARKAKSDVTAAAAKAKAEIRRVDPANRPALLKKVDDMVANDFKRIHKWRTDRLKNLGGYRKMADDAIARCRAVIQHNEGVVRNQNREMVETLFHECFHAFARNLLYTDKEIPRWLNEGMACYFEMSVMEAGELIHGAPNRERMQFYRQVAADGKLPRLESVLRGTDFVIDHEGHVDRAVTAYAVAWALAHYVSTRLSRDQMDAYVSGVAAGADPADALAKALGQPVAKIDEAVRAHVASLR